MAKRVKKKNKTKHKILITLLIIVILLISAFFFLYNKYLGGMNQVDINEDELLINEEIETTYNKNIINIALFGIDTRSDTYDGSRSDTIVVATIDKDHNKIKLTSIMRDTYVSIPDNKYDKINHSYAFGGPTLTIKTINQNFDLNIKDYVTVNFIAMEKIIDAIGGVEIDVKSSEVSYIKNGVIGSGLQTLNGKQAVAYSRIRHTGNGDYERTERQRTVLEKIFSKVINNKSLPQTLDLVENMSPYIETSLSTTEMIGLVTTVFSSGIKDMEDYRIPVDGSFKGGLWGGVSYLKPNTLVENSIYIHKFIYEDDSYVPSSIVEEISNKIKDSI